MKKISAYLLLLSLLSCSSSNIERNPYLQEIRFSYTVNINLPAYNGLKTPLNPVHINASGVGLKGVIIINTGSSSYLAWEAACPNHLPSACVAMQVKGIEANCSCDNNVYSLVNGSVLSTDSDKNQYPLLNYAVSVSGNYVTISN